jgi:excalibur calcium-binding domain-containing protein
MLRTALATAAITAGIVLAPAVHAAPSTTSPKPAPATGGSDVYYPNCAAARAAGVAPIYRGQPGYRSGLDRDGDGIACE